MHGNLIEAIMGAVVLVVAGAFLGMAISWGGVGAVEGYPLSATFGNVGGVKAGSDVLIRGIRVGTVTGTDIDPNSLNAVVHLSIENNIHLPEDSVAVIGSDGLTGGASLELRPGHSRQTIAAGGTLGRVENYKPLEETVGQMIFSPGNQQAARPSSPPRSPP